jgi:hypothetical protein
MSYIWDSIWFTEFLNEGQGWIDDNHFRAPTLLGKKALPPNSSLSDQCCWAMAWLGYHFLDILIR